MTVVGLLSGIHGNLPVEPVGPGNVMQTEQLQCRVPVLPENFPVCDYSTCYIIFRKCAFLRHVVIEWCSL